MEYSLCVYKNEYSERQVDYFRKAFRVADENEKTLLIIGEGTELDKVMSAMFTTDEQFKALFPEYQTRKEREEWTNKALADLKDNVARTLCKIINQGETDNVLFDKFRTFYLNELAK